MQGILHMIRITVNKIIEKLEPHRSCKFMNLIQTILNKKVKFFYDSQINLFYAKEGKSFHYFTEKLRGFYLYANGIKLRSTNLAKTYFIDEINIDKDDIIFDCGANSGDLYPYLSEFINPKNYHTFEPCYSDFRSLNINASSSKNNNLGLHKEKGIKTFYISSKGGDSSFIEPANGYDEVLNVETTTIDHYCIRNKINKIKLLKLESEGLEPEILLGSNKMLNKIKFIAIDGGEERGVQMDETLSDVCNILIPKNFECIKIGLKNKMGRAIFRNKNL